MQKYKPLLGWNRTTAMPYHSMNKYYYGSNTLKKKYSDLFLIKTVYTYKPIK